MRIFIFLTMFLMAIPSAHALSFIKTQIITSGNMASNVTSSGIDILKMEQCSIQAVWSGSSPTGAFKIQASNDIVSSAASVSTWSDLSDSSYSITADGDFMWALSPASYRFIRLVYTRTSGTGTLNAKALCKGN